MTTTINKEEIQKFSNLAEEWWDVKVNLNLYTCLILLELNTYYKKLNNILIFKINNNFLKGLKF